MQGVTKESYLDFFFFLQKDLEKYNGCIAFS